MLKGNFKFQRLKGFAASSHHTQSKSYEATEINIDSFNRSSDDARSVIDDFVKKNELPFGYESVFLVGYSQGGTMAMEKALRILKATKKNVGGVILQRSTVMKPTVNLLKEVRGQFKAPIFTTVATLAKKVFTFTEVKIIIQKLRSHGCDVRDVVLSLNHFEYSKEEVGIIMSFLLTVMNSKLLKLPDVPLI